MADFNQAILVILQHEGGWVSNPADPGGETSMGISTLIIKREKISAQELGIDPATMYQPGYLKPMKVAAAIAIYKRLFWDRYDYGHLVDQTVATKVFDASVNCGPKRAHGMIQRAANQCGQSLQVDGILGPHTLAALNACDPEQLVKAMCQQMRMYYTLISNTNPSLKVFLRNWLKRAAWPG